MYVNQTIRLRSMKLKWTPGNNAWPIYAILSMSFPRIFKTGNFNNLLMPVIGYIFRYLTESYSVDFETKNDTLTQFWVWEEFSLKIQNYHSNPLSNASHQVQKNLINRFMENFKKWFRTIFAILGIIIFLEIPKTSLLPINTCCQLQKKNLMNRFRQKFKDLDFGPRRAVFTSC